MRLTVQTPAGGSPDIIARVLSQWLSERFGQQFVVRNRLGASGNIGTETVVRAPADGYSLLLPCGECHQRDAVRQSASDARWR